MEKNVVQQNGLLKALIENRLVNQEQYDQVKQKIGSQNNFSIITFLIDQYRLNSKEIARCCADFFGVSMIDLDEIDKSDLPIETVSESLIQKKVLLPLKKSDNNLAVAISDPANFSYLEEIRFQTGCNITPFFADHNQLKQLINQILSEKKYADIGKAIPDAPIASFVQQLLEDAIYRQISDIHLEPLIDIYRIRMRIDGLLHEIAHVPLHLHSAIVSHLKVMADLDISEKRLPQDGRFSFQNSQGLQRDCRISSCPTLLGEKLVIRILDPNKNLLRIDELGLSEANQNILLTALKKPQGFILVTGPTGSGKSITLYTALNFLNHISKNISTIEDPIEIQLSGINQIPINYKAGLDFATSLRALLRQDPDIIMVGEIRDRDTAEMAIRASQTGHLVLSTLHTNNAPETLTRLVNMGIAPFNLASSVTLIIAQRLVRKLCSHCKEVQVLSRKYLTDAGFNINQHSVERLYKAAGCKYCTKGYKGRIGVFEVMPMTSALFEIILKRGTAIDVARQAIHEGMQNLWQAALQLVTNGITSLDEIYRAIGIHE